MASKADKQSHLGAVAAHINGLTSGSLVAGPDVLQVEPQAKCDGLCDVVQPQMSAGGHIIGLQPTAMTVDEIIEEGRIIIAHLLAGKHIKPNPNVAVCVLAHMFTMADDQEHLLQLQPYMPFAQKSILFEVDKTLEAFCRGNQHDNVNAFLSMVNWADDLAAIRANGRKRIQQLGSKHGMPLTNSNARYIRRLLISSWPRIQQRQRIQNMRRECFVAPDLHDDVGAVRAFLEACYRQRPSSISVHLPKTVPPIVQHAIRLSGWDRPDQLALDAQRDRIIGKMQLFYDWIFAQFGSFMSPTIWSDTLSNFAKAINPAIDSYNQQQADTGDWILHATSFVPRDLSPEMYGAAVCEGYFFLGQGMCYAYSANWRRDAVVALKGKKLKPDVVGNLPGNLDIDADLAFRGGRDLMAALEAQGVDLLEFVNFLRRYYFSGSFLSVNLCD